MKENVPQKKLFRCILAVTLAAGLTLPSVGAFADAPAVAAPAADDGIATAADGGEPAPQADSDGFTDYGGLSIQGGTPGTDYDLETVTYTHYCRSSTRPAGSNSGRDITVYPQ